MSSSDTLQKVIAELSRKSLNVFCGAGLSFHSGIPLTRSLISSILDTLQLAPQLQSTFLNVPLPFESVMEVLITSTKSEHLLSLFNSQTPNRNHITLAKLAAQGRINTIVTTNFDTLLVQAMEPGSFHMYYTEPDLNNVDWVSGEVRLLKLHGTVSDQESLAITIGTVASRGLIDVRRKPLKAFFDQSRNSTLLFFGYSFSDYFDITPIIREIEPEHQDILWIDHVEDATHAPFMEPLSALPEKHPLKAFEGVVLHCKADDFIDELWREIIAEPVPPLNHEAGTWRSSVDKWYQSTVSEYGAGIRPYVLGRLFQRALQFDTSNQFLCEAAISSELLQDLRAGAYLSIGNNLRDKKSLRDALEAYDKALALVGKLERANLRSRRQLKAKILIGTGIVYADLKEHRNALKAYRRALRVTRLVPDLSSEGLCYGNMGIVYKNLGGSRNLRQAIKCHLKALSIAQEVGDKRSEGRTLGNIGVTYSDLGDIPTALDYYDKARAIAADLHDQIHIGIWQANAGMSLVDIDNAAAVLRLKEAIKIFAVLGQADYVEMCQDALQRASGSS